MTAKIGEAARSVAAVDTEILAVNPAMGPASIEGFYDEALALPGLLQEIAKGEAAGAHGVVIACFDDTGLDAARALATVPVVGICESALAAAGMIATKISVVTTLSRSLVPIEGLVRRYGFAERARVHASDIPVLTLEDPASGARSILRTAIKAALESDGSDAVVLGCAGMANLARDLSAEFSVPVIDGVTAGVKMVEALVGLGLKTSKGGAYARRSTRHIPGHSRISLPRLSCADEQRRNQGHDAGRSRHGHRLGGARGLEPGSRRRRGVPRRRPGWVPRWRGGGPGGHLHLRGPVWTDFGFLGFYIAAPEARGKGYGWATWQAAMERLAGRTVGLDGVVAQQENYRKSGFELLHRNVRYGGTVGVSVVPDARLVPVDNALVPAIARL